MRIKIDLLKGKIKRDFYQALKETKRGLVDFPINATMGESSQIIEELIEELESLVTQALEEFVVDEVIPVIARKYDYRAQNWKEHSLYFMKGTRSKEDREDILKKRDRNQAEHAEKGNFRKGFEDLRSKLITSQPVRREKGVISKSLGEGAKSLRIGDYSPSGSGARSSTLYTNWFLAVELGTGIEENTGAWMRPEGKTKDPSGDGSWWLPSAPTEAEKESPGGLQFLGQKGFHMFWQRKRKAPDPYWAKLFFEHFPAKLLEVISERFPSLG